MTIRAARYLGIPAHLMDDLPADWVQWGIACEAGENWAESEQVAQATMAARHGQKRRSGRT